MVLDDCDISGEESGKFFATPCPGSGSPFPGGQWALLPSCSSLWYRELLIREPLAPGHASLSYFLGSWYFWSSPSSSPLRGAVQQAVDWNRKPVITRAVCFLKRTELDKRPEMFKSMFLFSVSYFWMRTETRGEKTSRKACSCHISSWFLKSQERYVQMVLQPRSGPCQDRYSPSVYGNIVPVLRSYTGVSQNWNQFPVLIFCH